MPPFVDDTGPITEEEWATHRREAVSSLPSALEGKSLPDILLKHQKDLLASTSMYEVTVTDKSRRIGATWGVGADAVLTAGAQTVAGGMDVLYIGYNLDMAREFIDTCAMWARAFMPACTLVGEFLFHVEGDKDNPDQFIQAFRIRFASGYEIVALSSKPRSLRGRQGYVILDEFAFHDDAAGLLKACMALLIWGGKILVISTHNGVDNPFNELINDVRAGKLGPGANVVRCTFDDAIKNDLYQRVCLKKGIEWTPEGEAAWRAKIRQFYRANAEEELDCIPAQGGGVYLNRMLIEARCVPPDSVVTLICPDRFELKPEPLRQAIVDDWLRQEVQPLIDQLDPGLQHFFGQDFARSGDASVYTPIAIQRDLVRRVPFVVEMRNVPFEQQKQILIYVTERLPRFGGGKVDSNGNGAYLGEVAVQRFGESRIERVMPSQGWYLEHMPKMKAMFEDATIIIPANDNNINDLRMIKIVSGVPMVPKGATADGTDGLKRHGDFAVSLCLAIAASQSEVTEYGYRSVAKHGAAATHSYSNRADEDDDVPHVGRFGAGAW